MIYLTPELCRKALRGEKFSIDLGLSWGRYRIPEKLLKEIAQKKGGIFVFDGKKLFKLEIRDRHYYKLEGIPPVLWIDGVKMQEGNPVMRAREKAREARGRVLDICTGLGYTAIAAAGRAEEVITVEKDPNVLLLARFNPWSRELFLNPKIKIIQADATEVIKELRYKFDFVIHDPPRFSMAGELYSLKFYTRLFRLLRRGGGLYHYVGNPRGGRIRRGVKQRLVEAGFDILQEDEYGFHCLRP